MSGRGSKANSTARKGVGKGWVGIACCWYWVVFLTHVTQEKAESAAQSKSAHNKKF